MSWCDDSVQRALGCQEELVMNRITPLVALAAALALVASAQVVSTASAASAPKPLAGPIRCC
jgi:uncharacterized membrane protein